MIREGTAGTLKGDGLAQVINREYSPLHFCSGGDTHH